MPAFKRPKLIIFIIIGAALIALSFWYFTDFNIPEDELPGPQKIESPSVTPPTTPPPGGSSGDADVGEPAVVKKTIEGDEFSFSPSSFSIPVGARVELTFRNIGSAPHNFVVDELALATKTIGGGKTDTITFTAPTSPSTITYSSYCSVPGHREAGMEGTIVIE